MSQDFQIFICDAANDTASAQLLYEELHSRGYKPWLDKENLLPGQDWKRESRRALRQSRIVLVLLSQAGLMTASFNRSLLKMALEVADEQPEGTISLIPLKLDKCELPDSLEERHLTPLDYFTSGSFEKLLKVLNSIQPIPSAAASFSSSVKEDQVDPSPENKIKPLEGQDTPYTADPKEGIINPGYIDNFNSGSGQQNNIGQQHAGRDIIQGSTINIHYHNTTNHQPQPISPTSTRPDSGGGNRSLDLASLVPDLTEPAQRYELAQQLLKCEAVRNKKKRGLVVGILPAQIRDNIDEDDTPSVHVINIVHTCERYTQGIAQLLTAVHQIEGDTKAWHELITYLTGLSNK